MRSFAKKIRYGLDGLVVIPKSLQAYLLIVVLVILVGVIWVAGTLMPFDPFKFYGWTKLPDTPVCPGDDINGAYESEVKAGPYRVGHIKGIAYWEQPDGDPLPGVTPIDSDLVPIERKEFPEASNRIAPLVQGEARPAWDATINGWMFGIVPVNKEHKYVSSKSITVLPISSEKCLR